MSSGNSVLNRVGTKKEIEIPLFPCLGEPQTKNKSISKDKG
jgi:hypothetical protein